MTANMHNFWKILSAAMQQNEYPEPVQLEEPADWAYMSRQARKQNLLPIFLEIAQQYDSCCMYSGFINDVQDAMAMVAVQIQKNKEFLSLYQDFLNHGLCPVVFKGIVISRIYGRYGDYRVSGDEDILIQPEEYQLIREILERKGYRCTRPDLTEQQIARMHEITFYNAETKLSIEVHLNIIGEEDALRTYMNRAIHPFEETEILEIDGVPIRVMNPTQSYLCLVFHGYNHFLTRGVGIRPVMDILKYEEAYRERICFAEIEESLKAVRADAFLRDIRWIGNRYFDLPKEENIQGCCPQELLDDLMETGIFGGSEKTDCLAANISLAVSSFGAKERKLRGLLVSAFPRREQLIERYPYLEERPWLLPVVWMKRFVKFGRYAGKNIISIVREILNKSDKRADILKKYRE